MNIWKKYFIGCTLSLTLLLLPLKSFECTDYNVEGWRFWLFQPDVAGVTALLPFTYTADLFYGYTWAADTTNQLANAQEWQAVLGSKVTVEDVYRLLYKLSQNDILRGKYGKSNSMIAALKLPENTGLATYFQYAKLCERTFASTIVPAKLIEVRQKGYALFDQATSLFVKQRVAYQILKLSGYLGDLATMKTQMDYLQKNAAPDAWVQDMSFYNYAIAQKAPESNYWLAMAFDKCRWNKQYLIQLFDSKELAAAQKLAKTDKERAILETAAAINYPGRALDRLKKVYALNPSYPALSLLLTREINKLENWLLTQKLSGSAGHFEQSYEEAEKADLAVQLKADLQYLHELDAFVQKALSDGKITDAPFWRLSSAHLMLIDGDFAKTRQQLKQIANPDQLPVRLQAQVRITQLLADVLEKTTIAASTENQIPALFDFLAQHKTEILDSETLQSQLALFLSDAFIQRGQVAKGVLLLSKTRQEWSGKFGNRVFYLKMLDCAKPADYDKTIALLSDKKNNSKFAVWLRSNPIPSNYSPWDYGDWDDQSGRFIPRKVTGAQWDLEKIKEFKARYYIWNDQLDSAYTVLQTIPDAYWASQTPANTGITQNPFSVGLALPGIPLTEENDEFDRNQTKFIRQLIELRLQAEKETNPDKKQAAYLLLGNAYFNLSWLGRWWSVYHTQRSSAEFVDIRQTAAPDSSETGFNNILQKVWPFGLVLIGFFGALQFKKRRGSWLMVSMLFLALALWNCKRAGDNSVVNGKYSFSIPANFNAAYYGCDRAKAYYDKAISANPRSETAIAAAYMAGLCQKAHALYMYQQSHPGEYVYEDDINEKVKFHPNSFLAKLPKDLRFESAVSCALFSDFLQENGR
jgi:hypothetical protein